MKKLFILFVHVCLFSAFTNAQIAHDFELFSETGDKFKIYVNGLELSDKYGTHVRLDNIQNDNLNIKIEFEDQTKEPIVKKYLLLSDPAEGPEVATKSPCSNVYKIKANKKGELNLAFVSRSRKKIQPVTTQPVDPNNGTNQGNGVTINTPVLGISITIFN